MKKKRIALIGAFDRNNYGDVFMPIIVEKALGEEYSFSYYALKKADLESVGGKKCKSIKDMKSDGFYDAAIIVGGEVLSASYSGMLKNLQNPGIKLFLYRVINKLFPKIFEKISKIILKGETSNPWIYSKMKLNSNIIIYNTVGGRNIKFNNRYYQALNESKYISVRDKYTKKELEQNNIQSVIFPDSVSIISKFFPIDYLSTIIEKNLRDEIKNIGNYFVFQVNKSTSKNRIDMIAQQIDMIVEKYNISCVLLPIGYAQGHEDFIPLREIKNKCKNKKTFLLEEKNIYSILYIISNSKLYIGTSLHGAITSISYSIPHTAFTDEITKLIDYLKTWNTTNFLYTDADKLYENFNKLLYDSFNTNDISRKMIELSEINFKNISNEINGE